MTQSAAIEEGLKSSGGKSKAPAKERAAEAIENGMDAVKDTAVEARLQAEIAAERATDEINKLTESGTKFVRENPGTAVVGALGVGILVGLALRGRD
jgi:ElaB/YqjD/DUF883 family membrane-anchored ribosome-binding protein